MKFSDEFRVFRVALSIAGLSLAVLASCGGNGSGSESDIHETSGEDAGGDGTADSSDPGEVQGVEAVLNESGDVIWKELGSEKRVFAIVYRPESCTDTSRCPGLVLVPDRLDSGTEVLARYAEKLASLAHTVVLVFDVPGRGNSSGEEDYYGTTSQDSLMRVVLHLSNQDYVDDGNIGVLSMGYGLTLASGALARFHETSLSFVDYLIDIEGPINRCYITQSPYYVNTSEGWYINEDGPGWTEYRCDLNLHDRGEKFPAGTSSDGKGNDGTPNSYICNQNAFPLAQAETECGDDEFFKAREPKQYLGQMGVHYLRLQFLNDHEQPTRVGSLEAMHYAYGGNLASIQLNNLPVDKANLPKYSEESLLSAKAFLSIPGVGNGFGTDVYASDGFSLVTMDELFEKVLPAYVARMQSRQ